MTPMSSLYSRVTYDFYDTEQGLGFFHLHKGVLAIVSRLTSPVYYQAQTL